MAHDTPDDACATKLVPVAKDLVLAEYCDHWGATTVVVFAVGKFQLSGEGDGISADRPCGGVEVDKSMAAADGTGLPRSRRNAQSGQDRVAARNDG